MPVTGVNVRSLVSQARRWAVLVVLPALVVTSLVFLYIRHEPKIYQATTSLYVQQAPGAAISPALSTQMGSVQLAQGYAELATNPAVESAANQLLAATYARYRIQDHNLLATVPGLTQPAAPLIQISVEDTQPARAAAAANAEGAALVSQIKRQESLAFAQDQSSLQQQLKVAESNASKPGEAAVIQSLVAQLAQFRVLRDAYLNNISTFSPATPPTSPIGPSPLRTSLLAAFLALMVFGGLVLLYDFIRDLPRGADEVEQIVGAPILGSVPRFRAGKGDTQLLATKRPHSSEAETYRLIRTNIQFTNIDSPPRTIVVTSSFPREGKTTTAGNLAAAFAAGDQQVLLVDADLRRPSLHEIFQASRHEGLTLLLMANRLNDRQIHQTSVPNLRMVPAGPIPPNPADLLSSQRMKAVVEQLRQEADLVVFDSPPILAVTDAAILSAMVDGVVLVVDPRRTKRRDLRRSRHAIEAVGGAILGVVLNRLAGDSGAYDYYYSSYGPQDRRKRKAPSVATAVAGLEAVPLQVERDTK